MKIAVAGSSGMVGSILVPFLRAEGHQVKKLVRRKIRAEDEIFWNPESGDIDLVALEGYDAIINLAGENLGNGRWTEEKKTQIVDSRLKSTKTLCAGLVRLKFPPKVLLNASAIGYYGNQGSQVVNENSPNGTGFLAQLCREWEESTKIAERQGIRVVLLRFGAVQCVRGGMLRKMLTPFKLGLGGVMGSGDQYLSWITIDDVLESIQYLLTHESIKGPVNLVTPQPITNRLYTRTLGRVLRRPTILSVPSFLVKWVFGEMGTELILASTRVMPTRLMQSGYSFHYPELRGALEHLV